jgi:hypothetical protein
MPKIVQKHKYHPNRKKIFELDDLVLRLDTAERPHGALPVAKLELMRQRAGMRSKWDVLWSGIVRIEGSIVEVETIKLAESKAGLDSK